MGYNCREGTRRVHALCELPQALVIYKIPLRLQINMQFRAFSTVYILIKNFLVDFQNRFSIIRRNLFSQTKVYFMSILTTRETDWVNFEMIFGVNPEVVGLNPTLVNSWFNPKNVFYVPYMYCKWHTCKKKNYMQTLF